MKTLRSFALPLAAAATQLIGCAANSPYGEARTDQTCLSAYIDEKRLLRELSESQTCCSDMQSMQFIPLVADDNTVYGLFKTSPTYEFPSGKSRFVGLSLPSKVGAYLLLKPGISNRTSIADNCAEFKLSFFVGDGSEWYRAIEPIVTFLSEDKRVLASAVPALGHERGDYRIPIPAGAAYAVVHTDPTRYGVKRRIFKKPDEVAVVAPGAAGALTLKGSSSPAAVVTATGWFTALIVND